MHDRAPSAVIVALASLALVAMPCAVRAGNVCFSTADDARLTFQVLQNAPPPKPGNAQHYNFFPLTGIASMQLGSVIAAKPGYAAYYFQWANRSNAALTSAQGAPIMRKANLQPSQAGKREQRTRFTSAARADACTLAQTASVLGLPQRARNFAAAASIELVSETQQPDAAPQGPPDRCVLPAGSLPAAHLAARRSGVLLDYEVQDGRSAQDTTVFLAQWAQLVHGANRRTILLTNPLDAPTQAYTGMTRANAHALVDLFDLTTILLWSNNPEHSLAASYAAQKAIISDGGRFDGSRILIDFELAGTSLADAQIVRQTILTDHLAGVYFWRNQAKQGGDCQSDVNAKIAAIAFGNAGHRVGI